MLTSKETEASAETPAGSENWAVNVTAFPVPETGDSEITEGSDDCWAVTPSRASHPMAYPALVD